MEASGSNPSNCLLSLASRPLVFSSLRSPSRPPIVDNTALDHLRSTHFSLLSAAERCIKAFASFLSHHPFLKPLRSLESNLQSFCQIRCRRPRNPLSAHGFAAVVGDSVAGLVVANGIMSFLNAYNALLVIRLVLTWFPNSPPAIVSPLSTLCDPYLNIFRGIIPPLGGTLDFSPILAFLVLNVFTSTAAALPAELPVTAAPQQNTSSNPVPLNLTTMQEKWMRRMSCKRSKPVRQ